MDTISLPLSQIKRYPGNPRRNQATVHKLAGGIREFGFLQPLVLDVDRVIIAGDTRYLAAQSLNLEMVPCVIAAHLTPVQVRQYRLFDNRVAEESDWDYERLLEEINHLGAGAPIALTGFEDLELADMVARELGAFQPVNPDEIPAAAQVPGLPLVAAAGDVWRLGDHRLACGDSRSPELVNALLAGAIPNLMVTDPPYGVEYDASWRTKALGGQRASGIVLNDGIVDWRQAWALFPGNIAYVWHAGLHTPEVVASLRAVGFVLRTVIIWVKSRAVMSRGAYHHQYEPCLVVDRNEVDLPFTIEHEPVTYAVRDGATANWKGGRKQSTVWEITHQKSETGHSTQKPVEAMRRPILNHTDPGDCVYEPFSGSGTTIIAAQLTGRKCLAVELNPAYVDLAIRRWQTLSGGSASLDRSVVRDRSGRTFEELASGLAQEAPAPPIEDRDKPSRKRKSRAGA